MFQVSVSFRGAKPRGNLLAQFHLLGKPVIEVTAYYEIATPLAGLAMTQRLPFRGKRSAVAEVNDSPVDCQSRNRARRSEQSRLPSVTEGLISVPNPSEQNQRFCPPPLKGRHLANKSGAGGVNLLPRWVVNWIGIRQSRQRTVPCLFFSNRPLPFLKFLK